MPSLPELVYAALLYTDDNKNENFVQAETADGGKLKFSFQRPKETSGLILEVFAFVKTDVVEENGTTNFSRETALLSGYKDRLAIDDDNDEIKVTDPIALSSNEPGTVSLKIKVPSGCTLEIDDATRFAVTGTSPNFTLTQAGDGISAGAYQVTFTVKKGNEIVHIFSEYINVINGLCTDTWSGFAKGAAKEITQSMISSTVYVRGAGGWYSSSDYNTTAKANDTNSGSFLAPFATIQKAVDKIIAINDGATEYTIYIDGTLKCDENTYIGEKDMADFSALDKELKLTIKALSGTATLDGGARFGADGTVETAGIGKRVICAQPASGALNLTLEKLTVTGVNTTGNGGIYFSSAGGTLTIGNGTAISGNKAANGGGVYVNRGTFEMNGGSITSNAATSNGGGVYVNSGTFTMNSGTISDCTATHKGGGVYVNSGGGTFEMSETAKITGCKTTSTSSTSGTGGGICNAGTLTITGGTISNNTASINGGGIYNAGKLTITGGTISGGNSAGSGGGVYVNNGTFTMEGGTIDGNTGSKRGGGVYVSANGKFEMTGGTISSNTASDSGGGVYNIGAFNLKSGTIGGTTSAEANTAKYGGGVYTNGTCTFTMEDGKITGNTASSSGGGVYVTNGGTFTMSDGTISNCTAIQQGGGVSVDTSATFNMSGTAKITGCKMTSTSSSTGGGGIYNAGTLAITGGTISGCTSKKNGGGIYVRGGTFTMEGGTVSGNSAGTNYGGGVYVESGGTFTMKSGTIGGDTDDKKNTAQCGGGVYVFNGTFNLEGGTISGNTATYSGGGVEADTAATFTMNGGAISGNTAVNSSNGGYGGGIYAHTNNFIMNGGTISDCKATTGGGLFVAPSKTSTMNGGTISGNSATEKARGVFLDSGSTLNMSGNAKIESDNDVYLNGLVAKICITGALTASTPVATITPSSYSAITSVLSAGAGVTITQTVCDKFAVSPNPENGGKWKVIGTGTLSKVSS